MIENSSTLAGSHSAGVEAMNIRTASTAPHLAPWLFNTAPFLLPVCDMKHLLSQLTDNLRLKWLATHLEYLGRHTAYDSKRWHTTIHDGTSSQYRAITHMNSVKNPAPRANPYVATNHDALLSQTLSCNWHIRVIIDMVSRNHHSMGSYTHIVASSQSAMTVNHTIRINGIIPAQLNPASRTRLKQGSRLDDRGVTKHNSGCSIGTDQTCPISDTHIAPNEKAITRPNKIDIAANDRPSAKCTERSRPPLQDRQQPAPDAGQYFMKKHLVRFAASSPKRRCISFSGLSCINSLIA